MVSVHCGTCSVRMRFCLSTAAAVCGGFVSLLLYQILDYISIDEARHF
jgi:hypothetical protein